MHRCGLSSPPVTRQRVACLPSGLASGPLRALLGVLLLWLWPAAAAAQQLELRVESDAIYANLPFTLTVVAQGFEEEPQPRLAVPQIAGCKVLLLGVQPNVSSMVQIVNGQRSEHRDVAFVYRYRVEAPRPGEYTIPALAAEQGGKRAQSRPARFTVRALEDTRDMQVRLELPARPVWVGETFDAALEWYLRRDVSQRTFVVPLFDLEDWVEVEPGAAGEGKLGGFHAGTRELELPFRRDKAVLEGVEYTRIRFPVRLTPVKAGVIDAAPTRVVAGLESGVGRDVFGFPVQQTRLYQATGKPVHLEVRALPLKDRPASFKNAVGPAFSLEVSAQRTVARVGDPIELRVLVRGSGRLKGLILPDLAAMGLSPELFAVPDGPNGPNGPNGTNGIDSGVAGELLDDGKGKLFRVTVRLRSTAATQIPALALSYFDPEKAGYQTVRSQPIALQVQGSALVGAGDVVAGGGSGSPKAVAGAAAGGAGAGGGAAGGGAGAARTDEAALSGTALVGADLALSEDGQTLGLVRSGGLGPLLGLLYGLPVLLLGVQVYRRRTQVERAQGASVRQAVAQLERLLDAAGQAPGRESAPQLVQALRRLRERAGGASSGPVGLVLERLETEGYSQQAATQPLDAALVAEVRRLVRQWADGHGPQGGAAPAERAARSGALGWLVLLALQPVGLGAGRALAQEDRGAALLQQARAAYRGGLAETDADRRRGGFVRAEAMYRELVGRYPDRPELLTDWGNAALLAQEPGWAVLAYRRALVLDGGAVRARRNLSFVRERLPEWLPRPRVSGAVDTLFFWHHLLSVRQRQVAGAGAFAVAVLLLVPWDRRLRGLAVVPALLWAAMWLSVGAERDSAADAVVVQSGVVLRSADSSGAPPALGKPLPAGAEVTLREGRGPWARVELADGQSGWLSASAIERVSEAR